MSRLRNLALVLLWCAAPGASAAQNAAGEIVYRVAEDSRFDVHTSRSGLFGFMGHEHQVRAGVFEGVIIHVPGDLSASRVRLTVPTDGLEVLTGADSSDLVEIRAAMRDKVLHVDRYPVITFVSTAVEPAEDGVRVAGALTLVGHTDTVSVDIALAERGDTLIATGRFDVRQTDFGIKPYKTALGTVQVADRIVFDFEAVGVRRP